MCVICAICLLLSKVLIDPKTNIYHVNSTMCHLYPFAPYLFCFCSLVIAIGSPLQRSVLFKRSKGKCLQVLVSVSNHSISAQFQDKDINCLIFFHLKQVKERTEDKKYREIICLSYSSKIKHKTCVDPPNQHTKKAHHKTCEPKQSIKPRMNGDTIRFNQSQETPFSSSLFLSAHLLPSPPFAPKPTQYFPKTKSSART